jgi:hypothetical protein
MVKKFLLIFFIFFSFEVTIFGETNKVISTVQRLISQKDFQKHQRLIRRIFANQNKYMSMNSSGNIDIIDIIRSLKRDGLFNIHLKKPKNIEITFKGSGYPLFFVRLISNSLQSIGFYRYFVTKAIQDVDGFYWSINLNSEYVIDPIILHNALSKRNCKITNIERESPTAWTYTINTENAILDVPNLKLQEEEILTKPVSDYWLNIADGRNITIKSTRANEWYPLISFFDKELHLLKVFKRDKITYKVNLELPKRTQYMRISDIYQIENIRNGLNLLLK